MNADSKTKDFLSNWLVKKKAEWITQQKGLGKEIDIEEIMEIERKSEITPWVQELIIEQSGDIHAVFNEILNLKFMIPEVSTSI